MTPADPDDFEVVTTSSMVQPGELARERVVVPEWRTPSGKAAAFFVYELNGTDYDEYQNGMFIMGEGADFSLTLRANTLRLLTFCLRDPNGNRLYPDTDRGVAALGAMGQTGIDRLGTAARRLNGTSKSARRAAEGNSGAAPSGNSTTVLLSPSAIPVVVRS